jgi:hypothetical protein
MKLFFFTTRYVFPLFFFATGIYILHKITLFYAIGFVFLNKICNFATEQRRKEETNEDNNSQPTQRARRTGVTPLSDPP